MLTDTQLAEIADRATGVMDDDMHTLIAEVKRLRAERDAAVQELGHLADLARTADHETSEAYILHDSITDLITAACEGSEGSESHKELLARLKAAEDVCVLFGWTGVRHETEREKATQELWSRWCRLVGLTFAGDRSRISDEEITRLATQRDETRARTLAQTRGEVPC